MCHAGEQMPVYAVGGTARDLLLGRELVDLDLAVEGDAIALARSALPGARITCHSRFGTASATAEEMRIDLATARRETYARPGALPSTTRGTIDDDLRRRDFSVNAMALRLAGTPSLLDPLGGAADLESKAIRVLHGGSFVDDATRIFRALRYAARLGFMIEARTAELLREGLGCVGTIGGERLRREIELMFGEAEAAGTALEAAQSCGALQAVYPSLHWSAEKSLALRRAGDLRVPPLPYGFGLLAARALAREATAIVQRLRLTRAEASAVEGIAGMRRTGEMLRRPEAKPSGVATMLDRYPAASVAAFAMTTSNAIVREIALRYLAEWRHAKPILSGDDILDMGIPAGPQVKQALQLVRAARLDGWASSREDERALVARFAKSIRDSGAMTATIELEPSDG